MRQPPGHLCAALRCGTLPTEETRRQVSRQPLYEVDNYACLARGRGNPVACAVGRAALWLGRRGGEQCGRRAHPSFAQHARSRPDPQCTRSRVHDPENAMTSIRRYLLVGMLGALTLAGVGAAVGVYTQTWQEANTLFDYPLKQVALALRDHAATAVAVAGGDQGNEEQEVVIQIWDNAGLHLYHSRQGH